MIRWLMDTDHLTLHEQGHLMLEPRLQAEIGNVAISAITVEEALRGRMAYLSRQLPGPARVRGYGFLLAILRLCAATPLIDCNQAAEAEFQRLRGMRIRIGTMDCRIAATALAHNLIVLTRNRRDFGQVPGLTIEDWTV